MDAKAIKSLFEHGVMPEGTESNDYQAKRSEKLLKKQNVLWKKKTAEKQAEEKRDFEEAKHELNEKIKQNIVQILNNQKIIIQTINTNKKYRSIESI